MPPRPDTSTELPRRVAPQPSPGIVAAGDCGGCTIAGLLQLSVRDAYRWCHPDRDDDEAAKLPPTTYSLYSMERALGAWDHEGRIDRYLNDQPQWLVHPCKLHFGAQATEQSLAWWRYLRMAHDAGYYAITEIDFAGSGPTINSLTNHWVLLTGTRTVTRQLSESSWRTDLEVQVSCSVKGSYWIDRFDLLHRHGGFVLLLVRPR